MGSTSTHSSLIIRDKIILVIKQLPVIIFTERAKYKAIHYEIPPSLVLPTPYIQIFFSAPCLQACSVRGSGTVERSR